MRKVCEVIEISRVFLSSINCNMSHEYEYNCGVTKLIMILLYLGDKVGWKDVEQHFRTFMTRQACSYQPCFWVNALPIQLFSCNDLSCGTSSAFLRLFLGETANVFATAHMDVPDVKKLQVLQVCRSHASDKAISKIQKWRKKSVKRNNLWPQPEKCYSNSCK